MSLIETQLEEVTLCITSTSIGVEEISAQLLMRPTNVASIGEVVSTHPKSAIRKSNFWSYQPDVTDPGNASTDTVSKLRAIKAGISGKSLDWLKSRQESGEINAFISVYVGLNLGNNVEIALDRDVVDWLSDLRLSVKFDIYAFGEDGD